jgi:hypothetical protein
MRCDPQSNLRGWNHVETDGIHAAHQGVSGMTERIDKTVFWPRINEDIIKTRGGYMTSLRESTS